MVPVLTLEEAQTLQQAIHYMDYLLLFSVFCLKENYELILKQAS